MNIGVRMPGVDVSASNGKPGDVVLVTGTIGDHGIAIMNERENLGLKSALKSDVAPLSELIGMLLAAHPDIHCLRDPTRGGVAAALCDIASASSCGINIRELSLPVTDEVRGACDLLGFDVLNVANEGKALVVCPASDQDSLIALLRTHPLGQESCAIGCLVADHTGEVYVQTTAGGQRIVRIPAGEDLPRIC